MLWFPCAQAHLRPNQMWLVFFFKDNVYHGHPVRRAEWARERSLCVPRLNRKPTPPQTHPQGRYLYCHQRGGSGNLKPFHSVFVFQPYFIFHISICYVHLLLISLFLFRKVQQHGLFPMSLALQETEITKRVFYLEMANSTSLCLWTFSRVMFHVSRCLVKIVIRVIVS